MTKSIDERTSNAINESRHLLLWLRESLDVEKDSPHAFVYKVEQDLKNLVGAFARIDFEEVAEDDSQGSIEDRCKTLKTVGEKFVGSMDKMRCSDDFSLDAFYSQVWGYNSEVLSEMAAGISEVIQGAEGMPYREDFEAAADKACAYFALSRRIYDITERQADGSYSFNEEAAHEIAREAMVYVEPKKAVQKTEKHPNAARVLLVDSDKDSSVKTARVLDLGGVVVETVSSYDQAIARLGESQENGDYFGALVANVAGRSDLEACKNIAGADVLKRANLVLIGSDMPTLAEDVGRLTPYLIESPLNATGVSQIVVAAAYAQKPSSSD